MQELLKLPKVILNYAKQINYRLSSTELLLKTNLVKQKCRK